MELDSGELLLKFDRENLKAMAESDAALKAKVLKWLGSRPDSAEKVAVMQLLRGLK